MLKLGLRLIRSLILVRPEARYAVIISASFGRAVVPDVDGVNPISK